MSGWKLAQEIPNLSILAEKSPKRIFYVGLGGSALPADLANDYFGGKIHLQIIRDYQLPENTGSQDLVIFSSFSGNTEETLTAFEDGLRKKCPSILMSNGGELENLAKRHSLPFLSIPDCIQPRCATGYFFGALLGILHRLGLTENHEGKLEQLSGFLKDNRERLEANGKALAKDLSERIPIVYAPASLNGACRIWKIKLNENAKIQSFYNVFPELNHNEMVGFTRLLMNPSLIYLESPSMHPRIAQRMDEMEKLLGSKIPIQRVKLLGKVLLHQMFESSMLADYTSYYLAMEYGIDPVPVEMIEEFKKQLGAQDEASRGKSLPE